MAPGVAGSTDRPVRDPADAVRAHGPPRELAVREPVHVRAVGGADDLNEPAGFGLRLCKDFLDRMHGTLSIESEPGRGARGGGVNPLARAAAIFTMAKARIRLG